MTDNEIETVLRFSYLHLYDPASRSSIFLATTIHSTKPKVFTLLYTMIAFIFTGFKIKNSVQMAFEILVSTFSGARSKAENRASC